MTAPETDEAPPPIAPPWAEDAPPAAEPPLRLTLRRDPRNMPVEVWAIAALYALALLAGALAWLHL